MAKAKKNTPRSGAKQRKHTKQHLTQAELAMQKTKALARRVEKAHESEVRELRAQLETANVELERLRAHASFTCQARGVAMPHAVRHAAWSARWSHAAS